MRGTLLLRATPSGRLRRVRRLGPNGAAVLRPDLRRIAVDSIPGGERLELRSAADGRVLARRRIPAGRFEPFRASWSPDGSKVAVALERGPHGMRIVDGRTARVLHGSGAGLIGRHAWSADGRRLLLAHRRGAAVLDVATGRRAVVAVDDPDAATPLALSPDGRRVAFTRAARDLVVVDRETGEERRVPAGRGDVTEAAWAPDGRHIATHLQRGHELAVSVVDADTSAPAPAPAVIGTVRGGSLEALLTWSPDGRRVAVSALPPA